MGGVSVERPNWSVGSGGHDWLIRGEALGGGKLRLELDGCEWRGVLSGGVWEVAS